MTIYIDVLFLSNLIINTTIIFGSCIITKTDIKLPNIIIGGIVSALYSVAAFFPHTEILYTLIGKLSFSTLFVMIFFKCKKLSDLIKKLAVFFGVSFLICGLSYIIVYQASGFISNGIPYFDINLKLLGASTALAVILIKIYITVFERNFSRNSIIQNVEFTIQSKRIKSKILLDTGCELKEPLSGKPVILINDEFCGESKRFVQIKTASGNSMDYIPVYKPDEIINQNTKYLIHKDDCYIGFVKIKFSDDGLYNGVAPPEAFKDNDKINYYRRNLNVSKTKEICMENVLKICKSARRKGILHRRKRYSPSSSQQGRGTILDTNAEQ